MGYIIHIILHFAVGACISFLFLNKKGDSATARFFILIIGGFAAISSDITKYFGDLYGHSLFIAPLLGLIIMLITRKIFIYIPAVKLWIVLSISVLSHIFIDYIGNGVAIFYPFVTKEYGFYIINDNLLLYILLIASVIAVFYRKGKAFVLSSLLIVALFLGVLTYSKLKLQQTLKNKFYDENEIILLQVYPSWDNRWEFMIRTSEQSMIGSASIFGKDIQVERRKGIE